MSIPPGDPPLVRGTVPGSGSYATSGSGSKSPLSSSAPSTPPAPKPSYTPAQKVASHIQKEFTDKGDDQVPAPTNMDIAAVGVFCVGAVVFGLGAPLIAVNPILGGAIMGLGAVIMAASILMFLLQNREDEEPVKPPTSGLPEKTKIEDDEEKKKKEKSGASVHVQSSAPSVPTPRAREAEASMLLTPEDRTRSDRGREQKLDEVAHASRAATETASFLLTDAATQ